MQIETHRRYNPLLREWVIVSPRRIQRPWQGATEPPASLPPAFDPDCCLCPGNVRAHGVRTPAYASTFVFDNDFPPLAPLGSPDHAATPAHRLLRSEPAPGICRVVCFSPRHDLGIPRLPLSQVEAVVETWRAQYRELAATPGIRNVVIFENRGEIMGASNQHPHGQVLATGNLPNLVERERAAFAEHRAGGGGCLLCEYLRVELESGERLVCENAGFVALVPFWAVWPFELLLLSREHCASFDELDDAGLALLAEILRRVNIRCDNLFAAPFPTSYGFHQGEGGHLHAHFLPPLLRSASVRKFMAGYELLATPQRDLTPEDAAARLRNASEVHYLDAKIPQ